MGAVEGERSDGDFGDFERVMSVRPGIADLATIPKRVDRRKCQVELFPRLQDGLSGGCGSGHMNAESPDAQRVLSQVGFVDGG